MQNFQDVENSKKIVSKQDSSEVLIDYFCLQFRDEQKFPF